MERWTNAVVWIACDEVRHCCWIYVCRQAAFADLDTMDAASMVAAWSDFKAAGFVEDEDGRTWRKIIVGRLADQI
ncbi:hypothetical protein ACLOJK_015216 [Asimina triloba]